MARNIKGCTNATGLHAKEADPANPKGVCSSCGETTGTVVAASIGGADTMAGTSSVVPASTFGKPTNTVDGPLKARGRRKKVGKHVMSSKRKAWLDKGSQRATLQAVDEMLTNSVSVSKNVRNTYTGGTRYSAGKFPVTTRSIPQ